MFKRFSILVALMLALAVAMAGCGGGEKKEEAAKEAAPAGDKIKIGFLGALTGDHASYGDPTLKGMEMAVEDINAKGGVIGQQLEIVKEDHRSDKTEAANVTQKLITNKVAAIVGDPTTGITKLAANICQPAKVVLISAGANGPGVVEIGDYIFRDTLIDSVGAPAVAKYAVEKMGWKNVALVTSTNNDYSVGLSKLFKDGVTKAGGNIAIEQSIQDKDQNFSAQVTNIAKAKVDGIIFTGYYTEGGLFMKEVVKQGLKLNMLGGDGLFSDVLWNLGGTAVEGSMVYVSFAPDEKYASDMTKDFMKKYKEKYGKEPDLFSVQGYDAVLLLAEAMTKANSSDPGKFKDEMAKIADFKGVSGTTTIGPGREPIKSPVYLLEVKNQSWAVKDVIEVK